MSADTRVRAINALLDYLPVEVMAALVEEKIADAQELLVRILDAASSPSPARH